MHAALRPYVTTGMALVGASVIAVAPIAQPLSDPPIKQVATRLLASSIANIPVNLAIDIANIPYYESLALKEYAYALGEPNQTGGVPGWVPLSATTEPNGGIDPATGQYTHGGTGSWWKESFYGNTWGWDDGNWPQMAAISHAILPFAFTLPIVQQLEVFAESEYIAGARVNCEFNCADVLGYLGGWLMFQTPLTDLLSGNYNYPNTVNAENGTGGIASQPFWAGRPGDQLNPLVPFTAVADNLMQDPSQNQFHFPDLGGVLSDGWMLGQDYLNDYNPFVTGSFLYWGAPTLYSAPALLAGLVQNFTGIPNQFVGIPGWYGAGGVPPGGENAGPASLLTGVPAGFAYLAQGLLGYLNPGTYVGPDGIALRNTLLRTYAWGSLPGADILRRLIGLEPNPAPMSTPANSLPGVGTGSTGSLGSGIASPLLGPAGRSLTSFVTNPSGTAATVPAAPKDTIIAANNNQPAAVQQNEQEGAFTAQQTLSSPGTPVATPGAELKNPAGVPTSSSPNPVPSNNSFKPSTGAFDITGGSKNPPNAGSTSSPSPGGSKGPVGRVVGRINSALSGVANSLTNGGQKTSNTDAPSGSAPKSP